MLNTIKDIKNRQAESITEPVTLAQVKEWLIIDTVNTDDDALLTRLITEVRQAIEKKTKLSLVERTITVTVDLVREFKLPHGPIREITAVIFRKGTNSNGTPDNETLTVEDYTTDGEDFKLLKSKYCGRHKLSYTAGFGVDEEIDYDNPTPEDLELAIKMEIAYRYEHRGDETNTMSDAGNATVQRVSGLSADAMRYIQPYIDTAWV
jgi:uncharacterized phiE125 gp8 family phage protein